MVSLTLFSIGACGDAGGTGSTASQGGGGGEAATCDPNHLFGVPNENTGLDDTQCSPSCGCGDGAWTPEPWTDARVASLREWTLTATPADLETDPYETTPAPPQAGQVCGFVVDDLAAKTYHLTTFDSADAAAQAGAIVTHEDACGLCSSLEDLAVYTGTPDLTAPVRGCGIETLGDPVEADVACLEELGFTHPCAQIWGYNTQHTRSVCLDTCSALLGAAYQESDGSLNACLQCDEDMSGDVFKAVAGRTRRNTGVASALCRPCETVARLAHDYP